MADVKKETILLEIDTNFGDVIEDMGKLQTRINNLKDANKALVQNNKELQEAMKKDATVRQKNTQLIEINNQEIQQNEVVIRNLTQRQREYKKEIDDDIKSYQQNEGSIKQMRLELNKLRREYESLSKADRESQGGQNMLADIQKRMEEVKNLEKAQGDFRREVGHYQNAIEGLEPILGRTVGQLKTIINVTTNVSVAMKSVIPSIKAFGAQLLKLAVNPVVLAILAVVAALKKLVDQFKMNDDAMTAFEQLFAAFQPIIDIFVGLLDKAVKGLTTFIGWVTKGVTALFSLIPAFKESSEAAQDYVKSMDALEEKERQYSVQTAKNEAQISELRAKAIQKDKYSAEQRKKFLEEAGRLEKENLRMEMEVAQEKLRLAKEDADRRKDTSDDTKNKIADLEANVWRAVKSYNDGMRSIVKATQKAMSEIDKEVNKDITLPQFNLQKKRLEQAKNDAKKTFETTNYNETNAFGHVIFNFKLYEENKRNMEQAEADFNNFVSANEETAKRNSKEMQNIAKQMSKNLLQARNDYEQAVIDLMDDSIEKQLKVLDKQHRQEIDSLKEKLLTEQNLTKEARELIQKTIELKEKKYNENRILVEAKYWSEVRDEAFKVLQEIGEFRNKIISSDPNRVKSQLSEVIISEMHKIYNEFETESNSLSQKYTDLFAAMSSRMREVLEGDTSAYSENVVKMMKAILENQGAFTKENVKSLDGYLVAFEKMREELNFTENDFKKFTEALYPYSNAMNELFKTLLQMPQKYTEYATNMIFNKTSEWAKKIRENLIKNFEFENISDKVKNGVKNVIETADKAIKDSLTASQVRQAFEVGIVIDKDSVGKMEEIPIDFTIDEKKYKEFTDKWGTKLSRSLSGILETISGKSDADEQLDWLVKNYEVAIRKIEELNRDLTEEYQKTNDGDFYNARVDESVIIPSLRRIYEMVTSANEAQVDYENERLEIQGRYEDKANRDLLIQKDLLDLEKRRIETEKAQNESRVQYLNSIRGEVQALEDQYQSQLLKANQVIAMSNEQLLILEHERMTFDDTTPEDVVQKNARLTEDFKKQIDEQQKLVRQALDNLAETGFLSVKELDEVLKQLGNSILQANNDIIDNTAKQTKTVTDLWFNSFTNITGGLGQLSGAFNSLFTEMGEMNEKYNSYAEAAAYFSIMLQMAEGIATAVAKGMEMGWPAAAVMIPVGIAAVVSGIASALSVYNQAHKPNYADGGLIGGRYAKTRSEGRRDDVPINASVGEYVVNAKATKQYRELLDLINFGGLKIKLPKTNYADGGYVSQATTTAMNDVMQNEMMTNMVIDAMSQIHPVVSVKEITSVQQRVKTKEIISKK